MKRKIKTSWQGHREDIGDYKINRILPNRQARMIGPFVFLDHLLQGKHSADEPIKKVNGSGAHPHRGIATLTYIINGIADHFDSAGNHARVNSGGVQWMKAGNGIIHDEAVNVDAEANDLLTHALQFWINLPAKNKVESPAYMPVMPGDVPLVKLNDDSGWLKVIVGEYQSFKSRIPGYMKQYAYHVHLDEGKQFLLETEKELEYAAFLPLHGATINDTDYPKSEMVVFDQTDGVIEIKNNSGDAIDIILFGGAKYAEPIVFGGPFVMNSEAEISDAYRDFYDGKYGTIDYEK